MPQDWLDEHRLLLLPIALRADEAAPADGRSHSPPRLSPSHPPLPPRTSTSPRRHRLAGDLAEGDDEGGIAVYDHEKATSPSAMRALRDRLHDEREDLHYRIENYMKVPPPRAVGLYAVPVLPPPLKTPRCPTPRFIPFRRSPRHTACCCRSTDAFPCAHPLPPPLASSSRI